MNALRDCGELVDVRFGEHAAPAIPGIDAAGDARALIPPGPPPRWPEPIPGGVEFGSFGPGQRYLIRMPAAWNGRLVVAGTPAVRSEFANDLIFAERFLGLGYAFASANKRIPYGALPLRAGEPADALTYAVEFADAPAGTRGARLRFGALEPRFVGIEEWNDDLGDLVVYARDRVLRAYGRVPERTYAVGLSNGGGQVRALLERCGDEIDGGFEWAGVAWTAHANLLDHLPAFLDLMPAYVASGFRDRDAHDAIVALGYPPDRTQASAEHPSFWWDHHARTPPFYADVTTFLFAHLLEGRAMDVATPQARARFRLSPAARANVARFAHSGRIRKPLVSLVAEADMLVVPGVHAAGYASAVRRSGTPERFEQFVVADGAHVDAHVALGYGLRPMLPFANAAFDRLVRIVEGEPPALAPAGIRIAEPGELAT